MKIRSVDLLALFAVLTLLATPGAAQPPVEAVAEPAVAPVADAEAPPELVRVAMETALGTITFDLDKTNAPITTANFLRYAKEGWFNGTTFYRVMRLDWGTPPNGLVQGGTQGQSGRNLEPIAHEPTSETGIVHKAGTISMARFAPGTAAGDFTIMLSPQPGLDAQPDAHDPAARPGFAAFGHVVSGMDVIRAIYDVPLSLTKGEGYMRGQMIEDPVKIVNVRQAPMPRADTDSIEPAKSKQ